MCEQLHSPSIYSEQLQGRHGKPDTLMNEVSRHRPPLWVVREQVPWLCLEEHVGTKSSWHSSLAFIFFSFFKIRSHSAALASLTLTPQAGLELKEICLFLCWNSRRALSCPLALNLFIIFVHGAHISYIASYEYIWVFRFSRAEDLKVPKNVDPRISHLVFGHSSQSRL